SPWERVRVRGKLFWATLLLDLGDQHVFENGRPPLTSLDVQNRGLTVAGLPCQVQRKVGEDLGQRRVNGVLTGHRSCPPTVARSYQVRLLHTSSVVGFESGSSSADAAESASAEGIQIWDGSSGSLRPCSASRRVS